MIPGFFAAQAMRLSPPARLGVIQSAATGSPESYPTEGQVGLTDVLGGSSLVLLIYLAHDFTGASDGYPVSVSDPAGGSWQLANRATGDMWGGYGTSVSAYFAPSVSAGNQTIDFEFQGPAEYFAVLYEVSAGGELDTSGVEVFTAPTDELLVATSDPPSIEGQLAFGLVGLVDANGSSPRILINPPFTSDHYGESEWHAYLAATAEGPFDDTEPLQMLATWSGDANAGALGVVVVLEQVSPVPG